MVVIFSVLDRRREARAERLAHTAAEDVPHGGLRGRGVGGRQLVEALAFELHTHAPGCITPRATEKQQILVIRNRRNRPDRADFWLGSVRSTVPE